MLKCVDIKTLSLLPFMLLTSQTAVSQTVEEHVDSIQNEAVQAKPGAFKRLGHRLYEFVKDFSRVDTNYVEPQHYNYTVMLQNTNTYEMYRLTTDNGNSFTFSPKPSIKLGPYVGWRWIFLGYTIDLNHLSSENKKKEFDLSLYSSQIGVDLFYRHTGDDFRIRKAYLGENVDTKALKNVSYDGVSASIVGFNLYYIFNHKKFSYPAAFSQSTVQKRSCGSPMVGIGYTRHSLSVDWEKMTKLVADRLGQDVADTNLGPIGESGKVKYTDISISGGYGYNYVFAPRWLFASSLSIALAYKKTISDVEESAFSFRDFSIRNFNIDGVGRFGVVWNNNKWYVGANTILHSYNYNKKRFSTNNIFGSVNIYVGVNFGKR